MKCLHLASSVAFRSAKLYPARNRLVDAVPGPCGGIGELSATPYESWSAFPLQWLLVPTESLFSSYQSQRSPLKTRIGLGLQKAAYALVGEYGLCPRGFLPRWAWTEDKGRKSFAVLPGRLLLNYTAIANVECQALVGVHTVLKIRLSNWFVRICYSASLAALAFTVVQFLATSVPSGLSMPVLASS